MDELLGKYKGCMLGGAVGDALGYPVEFMKADEIMEEYGQDGIREHKLYQGTALVSDDTQMSLFTVCGLLKGYTRFCLRGIMGDWASYVHLAYRDWMATQFENYGYPVKAGASWILNVPELYSCRAPGNTCLNALETNKCGRIYSPLNNSKGCGGVMRVAPVGLYLTKHLKEIKAIDQVGVEVAAITHGHPLGYVPAAAFVHIIARIVTTEDSLEKIVAEAIEVVCEMYQDKEGIEIFRGLMEQAVELSHGDKRDAEAVSALGEGWTAEEALAIAVYCSLKHSDDFAAAVCAAVNHSGDSDSTGAITGNILGAYLGVESIPDTYLEHLEMRELIEELAEDLYEDCKMTEYGDYQDQIWVDKYIYGSYIGQYGGA